MITDIQSDTRSYEFHLSSAATCLPGGQWQQIGARSTELGARLSCREYSIPLVAGAAGAKQLAAGLQPAVLLSTGQQLPPVCSLSVGNAVKIYFNSSSARDYELETKSQSCHYAFRWRAHSSLPPKSYTKVQIEFPNEAQCALFSNLLQNGLASLGTASQLPPLSQPTQSTQESATELAEPAPTPTPARIAARLADPRFRQLVQRVSAVLDADATLGALADEFARNHGATCMPRPPSN